MRGAHPHIVQQVVNQIVHLRHLVDDPQVADLTVMISRPAGDILFHTVEEWVEIRYRASESLFVALMLVRMGGLSNPQDLIGFTVSSCKAGAVLIVVV